MKALLVYAHPNPASFNAAMLQTALQTLGEMGYATQVSDLYAMGFDPVLSGPELVKSLSLEYAPAVLDEMEKVRWADVLIFQFPDWWYGFPAILKGWVDRVLAYGFAYDEQHDFERGMLKGKRAMLSMTVGFEPAYYLAHSQRDLEKVLAPIHYGILHFCGLSVLPPFITYAPGSVTLAEREQMLLAWQQRLRELQHLTPLDVGGAL